AVALARRQVGPLSALRRERGEELRVQTGEPVADARQQKLADDVVEADEAQRRIEEEHERQAREAIAKRLGVELVEVAGTRPQAREDIERDLDVLRKHHELVEARLLLGGELRDAEAERLRDRLVAGAGVLRVEERQSALV